MKEFGRTVSLPEFYIPGVGMGGRHSPVQRTWGHDFGHDAEAQTVARRI